MIRQIAGDRLRHHPSRRREKIRARPCCSSRAKSENVAVLGRSRFASITRRNFFTRTESFDPQWNVKRHVNGKAKGTRNKHRSIRRLEAAGYACTRAAASLGDRERMPDVREF